jgi:hypothetical protein
MAVEEGTLQVPLGTPQRDQVADLGLLQSKLDI